MTVSWWFLCVAVASSMAGQVLLKSGAGAASFLAQLFDWRTMIGLGVYGAAAILYIVALRRIPLSVALPCTAVSYIVAALVGHYAFAEPLTAMHVAAISVIATGVAMLAWA